MRPLPSARVVGDVTVTVQVGLERHLAHQVLFVQLRLRGLGDGGHPHVLQLFRLGLKVPLGSLVFPPRVVTSLASDGLVVVMEPALGLLNLREALLDRIGALLLLALRVLELALVKLSSLLSLLASRFRCLLCLGGALLDLTEPVTLLLSPGLDLDLN